MKLPALKMQQSGKVIYLTQMTAGQLDSCAYTAEWDPDLKWDIERQGFQRAPVRMHYQAIGHFLSQWPDPFMPTAALLSAQESEQGKLRFTRAKKDDTGLGILDIPEGRQLLILDYQHRLRGLRYAIEELGTSQLSEFIMPVIIVRDIPRYEEIRQFYLINSKQRRIDTDLALALLQTLAGNVSEQELYELVGPGKRYRIRGTRLTFKLAAQTRGPWAGRIKQPHDLPQPRAVIKVKSFVDSLAPVLSKRASCSRLDDAPLLKTLNDFWLAISDIVPDAFKEPASFQIQRTVGVYAFHLVFARRIYPNCESRGKVSKEAFRKELAPARADFINANFWRTGGPASVYVGSSGYRELFRLILDKIPDKTSQ